MSSSSKRSGPKYASGKQQNRLAGSPRKMSLPLFAPAQGNHISLDTRSSLYGLPYFSKTPSNCFKPLSPESPIAGLPSNSYTQQQQQKPSISPTTSQFYLSSSQQPYTPPQTPHSLPPIIAGSPISQQAASSAPKPSSASKSSPPVTLSIEMLDNHTLNPLFLSRYLPSSSLGAGGYGFVVVALDLRNPLHPAYAGHLQPNKHTHREVAVKFILREKIPSYAWVSYSGGGEMGDGMPEVGDRVPMECEVLKRVNHWGVVRGEGLYADEKFFYLVCPLSLIFYGLD